MANNISNKSMNFFKSLFRPPVELPYADKKLTIFHKIIIKYVWNSRKISEIPDTISYFEWQHVRNRLNFTKIVLMILSPIFTCGTIGKYVHDRQMERLERSERRKFGAIQVAPKQ